MTIQPESIRVGQCYLDDRQRFLYVTHITPDNLVRFKYHEPQPAMADAWWAGMLNLRDFATAVIREVPCDGTPEKDG